MTPDYLRQLADLADPDELWRSGPFDRDGMTPQQRQQLDTGIALRRHAHDVEELRALLGTGKSRLLTPYGPNVTDVRSIDTPIPEVAERARRHGESSKL